MGDLLRRGRTRSAPDGRAAERALATLGEVEPAVPAQQQQAVDSSLGSRVIQSVLVAPTILNWLVLGWALWVGTLALIDSEGVSHSLRRSRNWNFAHVFFATTCSTAISPILAHMMFTFGAIAQRHRLTQEGAVDEKGYTARLAEAEEEAARLSTAERMHVMMVTAGILLASFFVFDFLLTWEKWVGGGLAVFLALTWTVHPKVRAAVLRKQRMQCVVWARDTLRGLLAGLVVQGAVVARCAHCSARTFLL